VNHQVIRDAAVAIAELVDQLEEQGIGPELAQKITVAAVPSIVQGVIYPYDGTGYAIA
jgi:hypothetical protein